MYREETVTATDLKQWTLPSFPESSEKAPNPPNADSFQWEYFKIMYYIVSATLVRVCQICNLSLDNKFDCTLESTGELLKIPIL